MDLHLSETQEAAVAKAIDWYRCKRIEQPVFRLFGYAGTGKTTVLDEMTKRMGMSQSEIMFVAPTGRAAVVMTNKGCPASTVHHAFYKVFGTNENERLAVIEEIEDIDDRLSRGLDPHNRQALTNRRRALMDRLLSETLRPAVDFIFKGTMAVPHGTRLIVVDEASMLRSDDYIDLASLCLPIILVGDPGQLPPVNDSRKLTVNGGPADVFLKEVHRQQGDSSILDLAWRARDGMHIADGQDYDDLGQTLVRVITSKVGSNMERISACHSVDFSHYDQIIVRTNDKRRYINKYMHDLLGMHNIYPTGAPGEKLLCMANFQKDDVFISNGSQFSVVHDTENKSEIRNKITQNIVNYPVRITSLDDNPIDLSGVSLWTYHFENGIQRDKNRETYEEYDAKKLIQADWAWAITAHRAQGGQWRKVCVFDHTSSMREESDRRQWLYTAITRASEELLIIR